MAPTIGGGGSWKSVLFPITGHVQIALWLGHLTIIALYELRILVADVLHENNGCPTSVYGSQEYYLKMVGV